MLSVQPALCRQSNVGGQIIVLWSTYGVGLCWLRLLRIHPPPSVHSSVLLWRTSPALLFMYMMWRAAG